MNFFKKGIPFVLALFLIAGSVFAQGEQPQEDVTDEELENFLTAVREVQEIRRGAQAEVQKIITDEGLELQRYRIIMMSKQNPQMADSITVSEQEQQAIEKIQPKIEKMNQELAKKFQAAIQENELTRQRFQEIARAVQSSPELQQRAQEIRMEMMQSEEGVN